jgi:thiol-disulfide isomerase/thioredoxin
LLAQEIVRQYGSRARFRVEDYGASPLAERFGVDKYPAVFVDDALIARPEDFYAWGGADAGRYLPWKDPEQRKEFQHDLARMIDIRLAGGTLRSAKLSPKVEQSLPAIAFQDLGGKRFTRDDLRGKPVLVEFWATWCPPCLTTLAWLDELDPNRVQVVSIAVESKREDVDRLVAQHHPPGRVVMGTADMLESFGGIQAVPTMLIADAHGKVVKAFYGAPPDLHQQVARELDAITLVQ